MNHSSPNKRKICFFPLLFLSAFFATAVPGSFFISPGLTIENGAIVRGYCLEYGKDPLTAENIAELSRISGAVEIVYTDGRKREAGFHDLVTNGTVTLNAYNLREHLGFLINDRTVARIITGGEGVSFLRQRMTDYENLLTRKNIQDIIALEKQPAGSGASSGNISHSAIQEHILRNRIFNITRTPERLTVDFQTTENGNEKVFGAFNNSATVSYTRNRQIFLRADGLWSRNSELNGHIQELITHYHTDHVIQSTVTRIFRDNTFTRLIAPYPSRESSRNRIFSVIAENAGITAHDPQYENRIIDITPDRKPSNLEIITIGLFNYSSYKADRDIAVEIYKYPRPREMNTDSLIFRKKKKNVSYLLFGDFDDPRGINALLDISVSNEKRSYQIKDELSDLTIQLLRASQRREQEITVNERIVNEKTVNELQNKINALNGELSGLTILKADIMKWPHHAHKFPDTEEANEIIKKMNDVINPFYIIWQPHHTQKGFEDYIKRYQFINKFLSSDETEIVIVSDASLNLKAGHIVA
jgi:hypothetical protein